MPAGKKQNRIGTGVLRQRVLGHEYIAVVDVQPDAVFVANRNSFVLEEKIARNAGYANTAEIYLEYDKRKHILDRMVEEDIMDYYEVVQFIWSYYREGDKGIPISL